MTSAGVVGGAPAGVRTTGVEVFDAGLRALGSGVGFLEEEAARLEAFLERLDEDGWVAPTRCSEWNRHDVVAHLASAEEYNEACFDGTLAEVDVFEDDEAYNRAHVQRRRHLSHREVHDEWLRRARRAHALFAAHDPAAMLLTSAGPYPVGLQAWHIGVHYATHNDDLGVPIPPEETARRTLTRARFCEYVVRESGAAHEVRIDGDVVRIDHPLRADVLPTRDFVDLVCGYLDLPDDPERRQVLGEIRGLA